MRFAKAMGIFEGEGGHGEFVELLLCVKGGVLGGLGGPRDFFCD